MEKAVRVIRRNSVRLKSLGAGHSELNMVISEQKETRNTAKAFMSVQNSSAQYMMKWAMAEENRALQDVCHQIVELNSIWTEAQRGFSEQLKEFKQTFDLILEWERNTDQAKAHLAACEQREMRIKKELKKAAKKATAEEMHQLENKSLQAERQKDLAQVEVTERCHEMEAMKLVRFKKGLVNVSEAYVELAKKCAIIFEAQGDIAHQLPEAYSKGLEDVKYTGSGAAQQCVLKAKDKVKKYRRQSRRPTPANQEPPSDEPPPYSPGDYFTNVRTTSSYHPPVTDRPEQHYPPQITAVVPARPQTSAVPPRPQTSAVPPRPQTRHSISTVPTNQNQNPTEHLQFPLRVSLDTWRHGQHQLVEQNAAGDGIHTDTVLFCDNYGSDEDPDADAPGAMGGLKL